MTDRRSLTQKRRRAIIERQNWICADCSEKLEPGNIEIDHRQALIHGGDNEDDNLAAICFDCHKAKTRKDVHGRAHGDRLAVGGKQRSGRPFPKRANPWGKKRLVCVNGHDRCYLGPDPDCPYCETRYAT